LSRDSPAGVAAAGVKSLTFKGRAASAFAGSPLLRPPKWTFVGRSFGPDDAIGRCSRLSQP
ncbi:unnamed protein product, partial [Gadus morhua 'NCC']